MIRGSQDRVILANITLDIVFIPVYGARFVLRRVMIKMLDAQRHPESCLWDEGTSISAAFE